MHPDTHTTRLRRLRPLALAAALLLSACSDATGPGSGAEPITELPRELSEHETRLLAASNGFAFELAGELLPEGPAENFFWSPLSASMLLGMILNGADGATYTQTRTVLGFDELTQEEINGGYAALTELLVGLDPAVTVRIGNATWTDLGFPLQPDFVQRVDEAFDAEAREADLQAPATLDAINGWAKEATEGHIETIFDELPPNAVMVLLNAIYFQGDWTTTFDRERTERAPFTRPDGSTVQTDLMYLETPVPFARYEEVTVAELPYGGGAFAMTVAVPDDGTDAAAVAEGLTPEVWDGWLDGLDETEAVVRLPRFELEWEAKLNGPLQALGMTDAFSGAADLSRLTPGGGVWLDLVKQKAFVSVDEAGTSAAAVTGGTVVDSAPPALRADRPFLFAIRERLTGTILFMGVVHDPTA